MPIRTRFLAIAAGAALAGCTAEEAAERNAAGVAASDKAAPKASAGEASTEATISQSLAGSADHSTLVGALRAAGLEATLAGPGPYTVFAPTNAAFEKLPAGTAESLMQAEQKAQLTSILTYHIVPGVVMASDLARAVEAANGKAVLATIGGGNLAVTNADGALVITDATGGQARVTGADAIQSNGIVHAVDAVLMPR